MPNTPLSPLDAFLSGQKGLPEFNFDRVERVERQPAPSSGVTVPADLMPMFEESARRNGVPVNVLLALGEQESGFNPRAVGQQTKWGTAKGIMQYLDSTAAGLGINPYDPQQAIEGAARQLRERLDKGYSMEDAVKEHFAGPDRAQWGPKTAQYGIDVMNKAQRYVDGYQPGDNAAAGNADGAALPAPSPLTIENQNARNAEIARGILDDMNRDEPGRYSIPTAEQLAAAQGGDDLPIIPQADPFGNGAMPEQKDGFFSATGKAVGNIPENFQNAGGGLIRYVGEDMSATKERSLQRVADSLGITLDDAKLVYWAETNDLIDDDLKAGTTGDMVTALRQRHIDEPGNAEAVQQAFSQGGIFSPEALAAAGREVSQDAKDSMTEINPDGPLAKYGSMIIGSTAEMVPALLAGMISRNPNVTLGMIGGQVYGQSYDRAREAGDNALNPQDAARYALAQAAAEAIPSALPISVILKPGGNLFKGLLKAGAAESLQEGVTSVLQSGIDKGTITPDMTWGEAAEQLRDSMIVGAGAGVAMKGGVDAANAGAKAAGKLIHEARGGDAAQLGRMLSQDVDNTDLSQVIQAERERIASSGPLGRALSQSIPVDLPTNPVVREPEEVAPEEVPADQPTQAAIDIPEEAEAPVDAQQGEQSQAGQRVTLEAEGIDPITGEILEQTEDGVMIRGDDGSAYQVPADDIRSGAVTIKREAPAGQPEPNKSPARSEIDYASMSEEELRRQLKSIASEGKAFGWDDELRAERVTVEHYIDAFRERNAEAENVPNEQPATAEAVEATQPDQSPPVQLDEVDTAAPGAGADTAPAVAGRGNDVLPVPDAANEQPALKWFGTQEKADAYIAKKNLGETHAVVQEGRRFEIRPIEQPPKTEEPKVKGHVNRAKKLIGGDVGDTITMSGDVGYATANTAYKVESIDKKGTVYVTNLETGSGTTLSRADLERAKNGGITFAKSVAGTETSEVEAKRPVGASNPRDLATDAAKRILDAGGSEREATRAATDALIDSMGENPSIQLSVEAPAAVAEAKAGRSEPYSRKLVRTYLTKGGEVGAEVRETRAKDGRLSYSYAGKWGGGSVDAEAMRRIEGEWRASKRGFTVQDSPATPEAEQDRKAVEEETKGKDLGDGWAEFAPESGTLRIPRADMPQIKAEHRGAMVNFLEARGITHGEAETVPADSLKPTQAEFSRDKVAKAKGFEGGDRSILVSSDNHVLDGHHQWLAKREAGEDVKVIRLGAPIRQLLSEVAEFPSATTDDGADLLKTFVTPPDGSSMEERTAAMLNAAADAESQKASDWASREYKRSGKSIELEGDGPKRGETASIDGINESRRDKRVEQHSRNASRLRGIADDVLRGRDIASELEDALELSASTPKALPDMSDESHQQYMVAKHVLGESNPTYGENSVAKALIDSVTTVATGKDGGPSSSRAVNDYLAGRRDSPPSVAEVEAEQLEDPWRAAMRVALKVVPADHPMRRKWVAAANNGLRAEEDRAVTLKQVQDAGKAAEKPAVSENKVFTEDAAEKARQLLRSKLGQLNTGIDPEIMQAGITLAGYHIEKGARTFAAYAKAMTADLGDMVKPYLKSWYMGVKYDPRAAGFDGMSSAAEVEAFDLDATDSATDAGTLVDALYDRLTKGEMPKDNNGLRKLVADLDGKPADNARLKQAQEDLEAAMARYTRDVVAKGQGDQATFAELVDLYNNQPNLNIRTSTSVENQAYSTPAPLAYLAARLAGIDGKTKVYEPTAGNGMLLITADPKNATANELESQRYQNLVDQGFDATQGDALDVIDSGIVNEKSQDAVITNPPFGSVKDEAGKATKVSVDGYKVGKIDHLIAAEALRALKDGGKATLIIGADKKSGGLSTDDRIFFNWLYGRYNVTGHFELDGKLYNRQGAGWPVRVITINGRKQSDRVSPVAGTVQRVNSWNEVYDQYEQLLGAQERAAGADGAAGREVDGATDDAGSAPRADARQANKPVRKGGERSAKDSGNVPGADARTAADQGDRAAKQLAERSAKQRGDDKPSEPDQLEPGAQGAARAEGGSQRSAAKPDAGKPAGSPVSSEENAFQAKYIPRSSRKDEGVLVPVNMAQPMQDALSALEDAVGDIDQYVTTELGYDSVDETHDALMGLQVDSVASAIYQIKERKKGIIIADQTGIGKGRQAASMIRWAQKNNRIPVFITVKPALFTDMYNDLADIGSRDIEPLIMNADEWIASPTGEKLFANKKATHRKTLQQIANTGELPEGNNALFLTYSQINTDNLQRKVLTALASRAVFVMDESHNAGGDSSTGNYVRETLEAVDGVTYLSATYAKRPDNMPLYFKTDIGSAIADSDGLMDAMARGGLPLQTVVSSNLVKAGQMFRRERSYDGVSVVTRVDTENREAHEKLSDSVTSALRAIVDADSHFHEGYVKRLKEEAEARGEAVQDVAGNQASESVNHTQFSSVVHNFVRQMLLGLQADTAAQQAIDALKRGEKPLIALENTMGSFLTEYATNNGLKPGDALGDFDYRTVLTRALDRTRYVVRVLPNGEKEKQFIPLSGLDEATRQRYEDAQVLIDALDMDIPVQPLDWIRHRLQQEGYSVAEITGRSLAVDYSGKRPVLMQIPAEEKNDKVATTRRFNSGELDAVILNVAGSTGISLHASEKFKDQRKRHMVIAQAAQDINIFMQMLGRVHRTGQVELPSYTILNADLPAQKRPTAILNKKMKSLNANTSSNTESATSIDAADMLNKYGDQVIANYLADNPDMADALGLQDGGSDGEGNAQEDIARKATGRMALMPVKVQKEFYAEVEEQYTALMDYLNETGQNDLEPRTYDFEAELQSDQVLAEETDPSSPFGGEAVYGEYKIKAQGKPMTPEEARAEIQKNLDGQTSVEHVKAMGQKAVRAYWENHNRLVDLGRVESQKVDVDAKTEAMSIEDGASLTGYSFMRNHRIGSTWRVEVNGDVYNGIVTNLRNTHKANGNPFSLSKIQVTLAVNGPLRSITVPASQWSKIEVAPLSGVSPEQLLGNQVEGSEIAKIVTGNLLAAYGELTGSGGTIISFTKSDGTIEQGILLPKKFSMKLNTRGDQQMRTPEDAIKVVSQATDRDFKRYGISSRDGAVRVTSSTGGIRITVPKSKRRGGKYFLDKRLTAITGDFVTDGAGMTVIVPESKAVEALGYLMTKAPLYASSSFVDEARSILGLPPRDKQGGEVRASVSDDVTNTPKFKRWFGDSKVVDDDGKPLVVYHGTNASFDEFRAGERTDKMGRMTSGAYFTADPDYAGSYGASDGATEGRNVMPVYLSLQNPMVITDTDGSRYGEMTRINVVALEAQGYDGVIYNDYAAGDRIDMAEVVAFRSEQIKSAIGNNGNFDPNDPDIRASTSSAGSFESAGALERHLRDSDIGSQAASLIDSGKLVVHKGKIPGVPASVSGLYRDGVMHLSAERLRPATAVPVMLHEMFHAGARPLVGEKAWGSLMKRLHALRMQAKASGGKAKEIHQAANRRIEAAEAAGVNMTEAVRDEEFGAYMVENYERMPAAFKKWIDDAIGAIKAFMLRRFNLQLGDVTPAQLSALAKAALRSEVRADAAEVMASQPAPQVDTPEFKRWFGDSILTVDGKPGSRPLRLYHGTSDDISAFDLNHPNRKDTGWLGTGVYLADKPDMANTYANIKAGSAEPNVMPLYARLENPYMATLEEKKQLMVYGRQTADNFTKELQRMGHDGVILELKDVREIVIFDTAGVKSAIGNNGNFDHANPDIRASVDAPTDKEVDGWFSRKLTDAMAGPKSGGQYSLLALAPMDRMIDEMAGDNMAAREYLRLKRDMDAYRTKKHTQFDETAQKWLKMNAFNREAGREMAGIMHDATIHQVDPAAVFAPTLTKRESEILNRYGPDHEGYEAAAEKEAADAKAKQAHEDLKARFDKLPAEFKSLYREVRNTYRTMTEELDKILADNLSAAIDIHGRKADRELEKALADIRDDGLTGKARAAAEEAARKKHKTAMTKLQWNKRARMTQLRQQFESNRLAGPYFPLARFGGYFVTVRDSNGKVISFSRFESRKDQQRFAKQASALADVQTGLLAEDGALKGSVDPRFISDVEDILGGAGVDDSVKDQVWQRYLESMPDLSMRKRFIHRKNREGFTQDALRAFASSMFHNAHQMGRLKYGAQMQETIEQAQEFARKTDTPERDTAIVNEITRRHEYVMNPKGSAWAQHLTSAAFIYQLSMSPAAALVNLSQTVIMGVPIIGAKHGIAKTSTQLMRATKDFTAGRGRADRSKSLTQAERDAMRAAYESGLVESTNSHNLAGVGETGVQYSAVRNKIMGIVAWMFHQAERFNREVTFLTAYRLGKADGMTHEQAIKDAINLTYKVHFDYGNTNRPRAMHGDTAKVALVFRNYQINMLYRLFRDMHQSVNGGTKAERKEALRQLGGITGMMALHAGVRGTWGYGIAMVLASMFFGDDAEEQLKKGTVELLGPTAAGMVLNGIPGHALDLALSERIGMPDLWFRSPNRQLEGQDEFNYWQSQLLGFMPVIASNVFRGVNYIAEGKEYRGIETMAPKFIKDLMRAYRYGSEGVTNIRGDALVESLTPGELFAQTVGFTPAVVSEQYDRNSALINAERRIFDEKSGLMDRYAMAYKQGDTEEMRVIRAEMQDFNKRNPEVRITPETIMRSLRARQNYSGRTEGGVTLNPKLNQRLRDSIGEPIYR